MSGGVDSSVAAVLLKEQGYDVVGVMLRLWAGGWSEETPAGNRCCSIDAVGDARRVAAQYDFPFYLINAEDDFKRHVVDYFLAEYARGRTPNPCTACNHHIKFDFLLRRATALDADYLASGHYARLRQASDGSIELLKAVDEAKDQSYMLYMLGQERLKKLMFPLGQLTKEQVRAEAARLQLPVANKKDSQEICFVGKDYREFLAQYIPEAIQPGELVDTLGNTIGGHHGLPLYTIGQRAGLNLARAHRSYVVGMEQATNRIVVGQEQDLFRTHLRVREPAFNVVPEAGVALAAKIRSHGHLAACRISPDGEYVTVNFEEPQRAVSPGQVIVFYDEEVVVGGGIID